MINKYLLMGCVLLFLAGCSPTGNVVVDTKEYVIGVSLPLTGPVASYGIAGQQGISLAAEEINAQGGIHGIPLRVIFEDDVCSPQEAVTAYNKLVNIDNVDALIGPMCSAATSTAIPIGALDQTPMLMFGSAPDLTDLSEYEFRLWPSDVFAAAFAVEYFNQQGYDEVALVTSTDAYGQGIYEEFLRIAPESDFEVTYSDQISSGATDVRTVVQKIIQNEPDIVYFAGHPPEAITLARQSSELGMKSPIFGAELHAEEFYSSPYSQGVWYSTISLSSSDAFQEKFEQRYDHYHKMAGMAYDAVYVLAEALEESHEEGIAVIDALYNTRYEGVSNTYEFDARGELLHADFDVYRVTAEGPVLQ